MPWAEHEPQPLDQKVELLRTFRGGFDLGQDFVYGILAPDESQALGGTGLHTRVGEDAFLAATTTWQTGTAVIAAWAVGAWVLGAVLLERRDV